MQEMTVDMKFCMFAEDREQQSQLVHIEGEDIAPNPPFVMPHNIWTKVTMPTVAIAPLKQLLAAARKLKTVHCLKKVAKTTSPFSQ